MRWTGKRVQELRLFREHSKVSWLTLDRVVFFLGYLVCLYLCATTIGKQYEEAVARAEEKNIEIISPDERIRLSALSYLAGESDATGSGAAAKVEEDGPKVHLPSKYLPGFWETMALGVWAVLHALYFLLQVWSVDFRCRVGFSETEDVTKATHAYVKPQKHAGKLELVPIQKSDKLGYFFEFQRRMYLYSPREKMFVKVRCRTDLSIEHLHSTEGVQDEATLEQLTALYGKNKFQIAQPNFMEMYKQQLLSPFTVFQIFCVILWLLDEYWQYSLFTLFMICTFEATVVFSRSKNLSTLKGMGNENRPIKVYRFGKWIDSQTDDLVPGDLFSLTIYKEKKGDSDSDVVVHDVIPCDCVCIRGSAVVNESSLTGESIPQMKDALPVAGEVEDSANEKLDVKSLHKAHAFFSGTRLLQVSSTARTTEGRTDDDNAEDAAAVAASEQKAAELADETAYAVPTPFDGGALCYCLRTGFSSSQGKLVRMIEHSQDTVRPDTKDTTYLLLLLLVFALSASGYVCLKGWEDGERSKYELLLHCILIITSVIPPELPMQMALAVNSSLMTLMKMQVFCTEPFRIPTAGKLDYCLFDKTGTLTTDELVAVGVATPQVTEQSLREAEEKVKAEVRQADLAKEQEEARGPQQRKPKPQQQQQPGQQAQQQGEEKKPSSSATTSTAGLVPMIKSPGPIALVLGGCHACVLVDGKTAGDPIEAAALKAIQWEVSAANTNVCKPKPEVAAAPTFSSQMVVDGLAIPPGGVEILARHHFSSKLQRMSVVCRFKNEAQGGWVLVKGSPEALAPRIVSGLPAEGLSSNRGAGGLLAKRGMRILALAYRRLKTQDEIRECIEHRVEAEKDLVYAGMVAFTCRVRKDTHDIVRTLRKGAHDVAMATGDALATAVHVAKEVGITTEGKRGVLVLNVDDVAQPTRAFWVDYDTGATLEGEVTPENIGEYHRQYDLGTNGDALNAALSLHPRLDQHLEKFCVFARMTPDAKERVINCLKNCGRVTLMCGDGANDVGALKQADVGVALLSGFGDVNVDRGADAAAKAAAKPAVTAVITQEEEERLSKAKVSELKRMLRELGVDPDDHPQCVEKTDLIKLYRTKRIEVAQKQVAKPKKQDLAKMTPQERRAHAAAERNAKIKQQQEELQREIERLTAAGESWAMWKAMQNMMAKQRAEAQKIREQNKKQGALAASAARMAAMMDEVEDAEMPLVKIGDASVAAPFTSKMPSIRGTADIIRQGRCTLVTTIQMYQILALNCLINAYSLSVLHLDGVKYGDRQMTALGMLMSVSFMTISRSKPMQQLSSVRPLTSIFHPALFLSLLGQFALHLLCMYTCVQLAKSHMDPEDKQPIGSKFAPSLLNSVVFLVTAVQQVSVFVVNMKGPPFMSGLTDNSPLLYSLASVFVLTFVSATEILPQLNTFLQLVSFPDPQMKTIVLTCLVFDVVGSFLWDRIMLGIFAYPVLRASFENTTIQDVMKMLRVVALVGGVVYWLSIQEYDEELWAQIMDEASGDAAGAATGATGAANAAAAAAASPVVPPLHNEF